MDPIQQQTKRKRPRQNAQKQPPPPQKQKKLQENILLIGNPGVGKSTLLNSLLIDTEADVGFFQSGISFGSGMTRDFESITANGFTFMDTPGFQDVKIRKRAAEAITNALRVGGDFKIMFVMTLESGRVRPVDVACMEMVLQCAGKQIKHYGVIINKLNASVHKELTESGEEKQKILSLITITSSDGIAHPLFLERKKDLDDKNNVHIDIPELINFIKNLPCVTIDRKQVDNIPDDDTFDQRTQELESELEGLRAKIVKKQEKMESLKRKYRDETEKLDMDERYTSKTEKQPFFEGDAEDQHLLEEKHTEEQHLLEEKHTEEQHCLEEKHRKPLLLDDATSSTSEEQKENCIIALLYAIYYSLRSICPCIKSE